MAEQSGDARVRGGELTRAQILKRYRITASALRYWRRQLEFPEPCRRGGENGRVDFWDARAVKRWSKNRAKRKNRRKERARRVFEQTGSVSAVSRALEVDRKTARTMLRSLGLLEGGRSR